jgi:hypothetical protein
MAWKSGSAVPSGSVRPLTSSSLSGIPSASQSPAVPKPLDSKKPFDYYKQLAVVPGDQAFFTAKDSGCPLTK